MTIVMKMIEEATIACFMEGECPQNRPSIINNPQKCINGMAADFYPCHNIDLLGYLNLVDLGSAANALGNDIWGWKDVETNRFYALSGQTDGSSIVDVTIPTNPTVIAFIPSSLSHFVNWRDMKIFNNGWAFVVADGSNHGIQYFNMKELISTANKYRKNSNISERNNIYRADLNVDIGHDTQVGNVHNIAYNEETGYLYVVGSTQPGNSQNSLGGLIMYDVRNPDITENKLNIVGVFPNDGYTHDVECVIYKGPDTPYVGKEICFAYNENTLTIVDVTIKNSAIMISRTGYQTSRYTHQGWLTSDMKYLLLDDELDESSGSVSKTTTYIFDITSLTNPILGGLYEGPTTSIDHNLYIVDNRVYESNYRAGLRILDASNIQQFQLTEIAYFDVYPQDDNPSFGHGIWSTYPFWMQDENPNYHFVVGQTKAQGFFVFGVPPHDSND